MPSPRVPPLRDVLEEHLDELRFLWGLRRESLRSSERTRADLARLDARIEAHADGVLLARGEVPGLVGDDLASDDPLAAFAAGFVLLRAGGAAARAVVEAFRGSSGGAREGLGEALAFGEVREVRDVLADIAGGADRALAVSAATALAFQRESGWTPPEDGRFLDDRDPVVRAAGWRLVSHLARAPRAEALRRGLEDPDPAVALEAAASAAWHGAPGVLEACRARASVEDAASGEWLRLLAVLAEAADVPVVLGASAPTAPAGRGVAGPRALGALGHPRAAELLLQAMDDADPARSAAAGAAFLKVTGCDVAGDARVPLRGPGPPPDDFEEEFLDEVALPDAERARDFWKESRGAFAGATRWCRGHDASAGWPGALPDDLDLESCGEARLRDRFRGTFKGDAAELVRFSPLRA